MSVTPKEFVERFRIEYPDERLTYQKILDATGLKDLSDANLCDADLEDANFRGANFRGANLWNADLWGANLQDANLQNASLWVANLEDANLQGANLRNASLQFSNLQGADLRGADLRGTDLQGVDLRGADLRDNTILQLRGLPSGELILFPTPGGWTLWVGDWQGTLEKLKTLVTGGVWEEVDFERIFPLLDRHVTKNAGVIEELAEKWNV